MGQGLHIIGFVCVLRKKCREGGNCKIQQQLQILTALLRLYQNSLNLKALWKCLSSAASQSNEGRHTLVIISFTLLMFSPDLSKFLIFGLWNFYVWIQINFSFHLKTCLSLQGVNSVICELHVNKALQKNLPETYQNLPKSISSGSGKQNYINVRRWGTNCS